MKLTFNDHLILNDSFKEKFKAWDAAEKFLNFDQKSYKIEVIKDKTIHLQSSSSKLTLFQVILKVMVCFTIALPLTIAALITKQIYRKKYEFIIIIFPKVQPFGIEENKGQNQIQEPQKLASHEEGVIKDQQLAAGKDPILQDPLSENLPLSAAPQVAATAYDVTKVIARIHAAKAEGLKVAIFMGRDNSQTIPNEKGWEWFSLDENLMEGKNDHHLKMNFNANLIKIQGLFNKVVSDFSTTKFYDNPWPTLHSLLEKNEDSELILESTSKVFGNEDRKIETVELYPQNIFYKEPALTGFNHQMNEEKIFQEWKNRVNSTVVGQEFEQFLGTHNDIDMSTSKTDIDLKFMRYILKKEGIAPIYPTYDYAIHKSIEGLLKDLFFNKVELFFGLFPYRTEAVETTYWRLRNPKVLSKYWKNQARQKGYK